MIVVRGVLYHDCHYYDYHGLIMTGRIENYVSPACARQKPHAGLVPFIMAGDPDMETTAALLEALPKAGADIIEIGMPFS